LPLPPGQRYSCGLTQHPVPKGRASPGRKGAVTRARLMNAARAMLSECSPLDLTAIAVSRTAGTAPPSFYVYFADIRALMLALAEEAADSLIAVADVFAVDWPPPDIQSWAVQFVERFIAVWRANAEVLAFRNLEADRGDIAFDASRVRSSLPILTALTDRMIEAYPPGAAPRRVDCFAEAVILYASMERLAATTLVERAEQLQPRHYVAAFSRMIARVTLPQPAGADR
jgi:AcrR family transcriptional regulator